MDVINTIQAAVGPALLVIMRIGGMAIFAPVISSPSVPVRVRVLLVFLAGFGAFSLLSSGGAALPEVPLDPWAILPLAASEVAVGALIGFIASLPLMGLRMGGMIAGQQMGLGFARFYNPAVGEESDVLEQIFYFLGLAIFLSIGGLEAMFIAVLHSFEYVNAGIFATGRGVLDIVLGMLLSSLDIGLRVALGFVSKTVPQLNVLSLGFPLRIMVGLGILVAGVAVIDQVANEWIAQALDDMYDWASAPRGEVV